MQFALLSPGFGLLASALIPWGRAPGPSACLSRCVSPDETSFLLLPPAPLPSVAWPSTAWSGLAPGDGSGGRKQGKDGQGPSPPSLVTSLWFCCVIFTNSHYHSGLPIQKVAPFPSTHSAFYILFSTVRPMVSLEPPPEQAHQIWSPLCSETQAQFRKAALGSPRWGGAELGFEPGSFHNKRPTLSS